MTSRRIPEKTVQSHIVQLLRTIGARVYVLGTTRRRGDFPGTMQTPGIADLFAFLPPRNESGYRRLVAVECKAAGGRLRPDQQLFRELCDLAGVAHIVGDLDDVIAWLTREGYVNAQQFPHYRQPKGSSV